MQTCYEHGVGRCFGSDENPGIVLVMTVWLIALVLVVVVCVLKKKKICCFRAKTLPGEANPQAASLPPSA